MQGRQVKLIKTTPMSSSNFISRSRRDHGKTKCACSTSRGRYSRHGQCNRRCTDAMPGSRAKAAHSTPATRTAQKMASKDNAIFDVGWLLLKTWPSASVDALTRCRAPGQKRALASQETPNPDRVGARIELCLPRKTVLNASTHKL